MAAGLTAYIGAFNVAKSLDVLDYTNHVTAFIPNNKAFASVASALGNMTIADLASVMKYHLVQGEWPDFLYWYARVGHSEGMRHRLP